MRPGAVRSAAAGGLVTALACVAAVLAGASPAAAQTLSTQTLPAQTLPAQAGPSQHVVVVGLSGLRWSDVSQTATPALWQLAAQGSVGSLTAGAVPPQTCPADGWLTLNAAASVPSGRTGAGCGTFPTVVPDGPGATVPSLPALVAGNRQFHTGPDWGLLGRATSCATAVGPGAALALASRSGRVGSYLPAPAQVTAAVLSRCPLTVIDLGALPATGRSAPLAAADSVLQRIAAELPAGTTLLLTAPGSATSPPHLQLTLADGAGFGAGLLDSSSTRQPGLVVLTDLTPTVLGWLGDPVPSGVIGAQLSRGRRGPLGAALRTLDARDTADQVWRSTHEPFYWAYLLAVLAAAAGIGLACRGGAPERRAQRQCWWRTAAVFAVCGPAGTFLANLVPWPRSAHPAIVLSGAAVALAATVALAVLLASRLLSTRLLSTGPLTTGAPAARAPDALAPFGLACLFTVALLGIDVMTGSRLQQETPFGLSALEAGRYYGIGNEALGSYGITALFGAAWLALVALRRYPSSRGPALAAAAAVAIFAVFASGWPGFGGKAGGTLAMVPCFALLLMTVAGITLNWRRVLLAVVSGLVLFAVFALISYFTAATGKSDIGAFAGDVLHGHAGSILARKIHANLGTLHFSAFSPLIPVVVAVTGLMLWRPGWFRLKTAAQAYAAEPLLRPVLAAVWLMPVLGWIADDSGVIVPAAALPLALALAAGVLAAVAANRYRPFQASNQEGDRAVSAIAATRRPVPAHDLAADGDGRGEHPGLGRGHPGR
jgi:hypothetical protein